MMVTPRGGQPRLGNAWVASVAGLGLAPSMHGRSVALAHEVLAEEKSGRPRDPGHDGRWATGQRLDGSIGWTGRGHQTWRCLKFLVRLVFHQPLINRVQAPDV